MVEHVSITDPNVHEPKGASTASAGYVLVSDGAGGTTWATPSASAKNEYAVIYSKASDSLAQGTIGTTPADVPFVNNGVGNGATANAANNRIVISAAGVYLVSFSMSFATVASGDAGLYKMKIAVNGTPSVFECQRELSGTSDTGNVSCLGLLSLAASDLVTVRIESDDGTNSDDIDITDNSLSVLLVKSS